MAANIQAIRGMHDVLPDEERAGQLAHETLPRRTADHEDAMALPCVEGREDEARIKLPHRRFDGENDGQVIGH